MKARLTWALMLLFLLLPALAQAQAIPLGNLRARPQFILGGAGIAASPGNVSFTLVQNGAATASQPISITTTVIGLGVSSNLQVTAYFASTSALTDGSGNSIPSSAVLGMCSTCIPASYTAFTQSSSFAAGSSLNLINSVTALTVLGGQRTDSLNLKIDLSAQPQTAAGTYTGTLVLAAQIF